MKSKQFYEIAVRRICPVSCKVLDEETNQLAFEHDETNKYKVSCIMDEAGELASVLIQIGTR